MRLSTPAKFLLVKLKVFNFENQEFGINNLLRKAGKEKGRGRGKGRGLD